MTKVRKKLPRIGVIHGRFQPVHLGHLEYLLAAKEKCHFLWIGISSPDPTSTRKEEADPIRSLSSSNPFTYYERLQMIRDSLLQEGVNRKEFEIVPFPINYPERIRYYTPAKACYFVTIYDDWGHTKLEVLRSLKVQEIDLMWTRPLSERFTTGKEVRQLIYSEGDWEHLVTPAATKIIRALGHSTILERTTLASET